MAAQKYSIASGDQEPQQNAPNIQQPAAGVNVSAPEKPTEQITVKPLNTDTPKIQQPGPAVSVTPQQPQQPTEQVAVMQPSPQITPAQPQQLLTPEQQQFPGPTKELKDQFYNGEPVVDTTPQAPIDKSVPEPTGNGTVDPKLLEKASPAYWSKYGNYNWNMNGGNFWKNVREANMPINEAFAAYNQYRKDNGQEEMSPYDMYVMLGRKYDPTKSIKEQDKEDRKAKNQETWEKVGKVFQGLSKLYFAGKGAPYVEGESMNDLTKRQQEQRDRVTQLRQAAGKDYLDAIQAKKAEEFKIQDQNTKAKAAEQKALLDGQKLELQRQKLDYANQAAQAKAAGDEKKAAYYEAQARALQSRADLLDMQTKYYPEHMRNEATRAAASMTAARNGTYRAENQNNPTVVTTKEDLLGTNRETTTETVTPQELKRRQQAAQNGGKTTTTTNTGNGNRGGGKTAGKTGGKTGGRSLGIGLGKTRTK